MISLNTRSQFRWIVLAVALGGCGAASYSVTEDRPLGSCCAEVVATWYLEPASSAEDDSLREALLVRLSDVCGLPFLASPDSAEGLVRLSTRRAASGALTSATFGLTRRGTRVTRALGGVTISPHKQVGGEILAADLADQLAQRIWKEQRCSASQYPGR